MECKVSPTYEFFNSLIITANLGYGKKREAYNAKKIADIIDILVNFGYKITYEDVYDAMINGCYINDIKKYNINFKDEFMEKCSELGYYP